MHNNLGTTTQVLWSVLWSVIGAWLERVWGVLGARIVLPLQRMALQRIALALLCACIAFQLLCSALHRNAPHRARCLQPRMISGLAVFRGRLPLWLQTMTTPAAHPHTHARNHRGARSATGHTAHAPSHVARTRHTM